MAVRIHGASDDLIHVETEVKTHELILPISDETYIALSNGVVAKVKYTGDWKINKVSTEDGHESELKFAGSHNEEGVKKYSDVLVIYSDDPEWVVRSEELIR